MAVPPMPIRLSKPTTTTQSSLPQTPSLLEISPSVHVTAATISINVNMNNRAGSEYIVYGASKNLGSQTKTQTVSQGTIKTITNTINGLAAHKTYYYEVVITNDVGQQDRSPMLKLTTLPIITLAKIKAVSHIEFSLTCNLTTTCRIRIEAKNLSTLTARIPAGYTATVSLTSVYHKKLPSSLQITVLVYTNGAYRKALTQTIS